MSEREGEPERKPWIWRKEPEVPPTDRYAVADQPVACAQCGYEEFVLGEALLNTVGMTLVGLDWANRSAYTLMCAQCGKMDWYGIEPTVIE